MSALSSVSSALNHSYVTTPTKKNSQNTSDNKAVSQGNPKDTYEPSSSSAQSNEQNDDGKVNDFKGFQSLSLDEVNTPGYRPKDIFEASVAAEIIGKSYEKKYGVEFRNPPTTAEGKKAYNQALMALGNDERLKDFAGRGVVPYPVLSSLNKVEGTGWWISDGAKGLIGHEVLEMFQPENATAEGQQNEYGRIEPQINEYGFKAYLPGKYKDLTYLSGMFTDPFTGDSKRVTMYGMDGGNTYEPIIEFEDALGLKGMSLSDRKSFLGQVQNILDQVAPGLDVRQLKFKSGYRNEQDQRNNKMSLLLDFTGNDRIEAVRGKIELAISRNPSLTAMKLKADASTNKSAGELTISVLDTSGNELPKNEVRLIVGDKSHRTTVDKIKDMDYQKMVELVQS